MSLRRARRTAGLLSVTVLATACASVSMQQEEQIGEDYAAQIAEQIPIVEDATLNRYINELGRSISAQGRSGFSYDFHIVNAEPINAFAIPGGHVYVNRGLIEAADNMSELAGVLAHEIGHVEERHSVEQFERAQNANMGLSLAYVLLGRNPGAAERAAIGVGGSLVLANYSRDAENEADEVAVPLLIRARIDPRGLPSFFRELMRQQERSPSSLERWFSTHPTTADRVEATEQMIDRIPESQLRNLARDSQAFQSFKQRMTGYRQPPSE